MTNDLEHSANEEARHGNREALEKMMHMVLAAKELADAVEGLIAESEGVYGLHLNGDVAPWSDLLSGGCQEEWLSALAAFRDAENG